MNEDPANTGDQPARQPARHYGNDDAGGDPVCWLSRVCLECGRFSEEAPPAICAYCGAEIEGE